MNNFRTTLRCLEQRQELLRVEREVNPEFELGAVLAAAEADGKACRFEHVAGSGLPVVGGVLGNMTKLGVALGVDEPERFDTAAHAAMFDTAAHAAMFERAAREPLPPVEVDGGPVQDIVQVGDDADITALPVPTFFELDSGPFITGAVGITRDPETGVLNAGVYRTLVLGPDRIVVNASSMSDLRGIYHAADKSGEALPLVLAIGADPALLMAAVSKVPPGLSELDVAGALQGRPVETTTAQTCDLPVPAHAEIVIEACMQPGEWYENTLGEYAGQYGPETAPVSAVTAITRRRDAVYHCVMAGANPEHNTLGGISVYGMRKALAEELRRQFPSIRGLEIVVKPRLTGTMMQIFISMKKSSDDEPRRLIREAFTATAGFLPVSRIVKRIVVVDEDVDIRDYGDVEWAVWSRVADAQKIIVIPDGISWELDRSAKAGGRSVRVGIDATMDLEDVDKLVRPKIPGYERIRLDDYL